MKCIICGNELTKFQKKYCCKECAQKGYWSGLSKTYKDNSKDAKKLFDRFLCAFDYPATFLGNGNGWYLRVFISACSKLGYSDSSISKAINKSRPTVTRHRNNANDREKRIAEEFLEDEDYKYKRLRPKNFSY